MKRNGDASMNALKKTEAEDSHRFFILMKPSSAPLMGHSHPERDRSHHVRDCLGSEQLWIDWQP